MSSNTKVFYDCNISEFDIELHSLKYYYYCEVVIDENGKIHYAKPSHQAFLIKMACDKLNIKREELDEIYMKDNEADILKWLMKITNCICVWYHFFLGEPNDKQKESLRKLQKYKCVDFIGRSI